MRLLPGSRCAYPGYGSTAVCGPVARVRRLRRNPGMRRDKYIGAASSPAALRLPGLRVLTSDSQPRSNPGLFIIALFGFPGGATGQLQIGSLGCSGMNASVRLLPGLRCAYPGYGSTAVCGPVARVRRLRRNPGMCRDKYIGAASSRVALRLPGYGSTAVCGPVARVRRLRRNPGMYGDKYIDAVSSRVALRLPGLRVHRRLRAGSPGQAFTPQPGNASG
ncbi:Uncharacterised protein [Klebsiella michiganensis]|uniref:Uncharacterized protein n=1 Tax=Klebsiella michiganensis TaxID=1134687 RepID=A0A7H4N513_9ENTR|nr:Uncharacterised protein [Klebsiella michiganensis]